MEKLTAFYKTDIGIIKITYLERIEKIELVDSIKGEYKKSPLTDKVISQIKEYLGGKRKDFDIYDDTILAGTEFQKLVWDELRKIPYGQTRTYKDIAEAIGRPKATRAVANAIGKNPLMIIIPCHRVIRSDGSIGGYEYGVDLKRKLLKIETII